MREGRAAKSTLNSDRSLGASSGLVLTCYVPMLIMITSFASAPTGPSADHPNDLILIYDNIKEEAANWKAIGLYLGFMPGELDTIKGMLQLMVQGPEGYLKELLERWLKRANPPDLNDLANAIGLAGNERLKAKLLQAQRHQ